jgi:hypothetical protein
MKKTLPILISVLALAACGQDKASKNKYLGPSHSFERGQFRAILRPLNNELNGWIPNGVADISITSKEFKINSWLDDSADVTHRQFVTMVSKCPTTNNDSNGDGFIDFKEAIQSTKKILFPLDSDLSVYSEENPQYPKGNFYYEQKIDINKIQLKKNMELQLNGKALIVLGTSISKALPHSVSSFENASPQLSIPIACGIIEKIN